ncbi:MAG: type II toxin-antitoxin system RelE/ParE family toxin [Deltaproteobacteria bacterium]|nr:type II toxin-antitoxin system RelE/ParE family toxin [Deltaproteobacteria bacterium]
MHNIEWTEDALKDLSSLDKQIAKRIVNKLSWFAERFDDIIPKPLSADFAGLYKFRIGDWRVIYSVEPNTILILAIGHRKEIYKR